MSGIRDSHNQKVFSPARGEFIPACPRQIFAQEAA